MKLAVKNCGGICPKFVSPGMNGMPDRLILLPGGKIAFAEIKAPSKEPRQLQSARHSTLKKLGFKVFVIDDSKQIKEVINEIQSS